MKKTVKTADLSGVALNWAVAKSEGWTTKRCGCECNCLQHRNPFGRPNVVPKFSTDWSLAGPIIERELLDLSADTRHPADTRWQADNGQDKASCGPTPLVAAMRCYVVSKFGDEIDVYEELL